ncbi:WYL domain-containing protein [Anaerocolumna sp. AGMB13025]|uniref:WYL domain-containing protein n=1 Tax=Anaerocolumna sp. AGMB13025 TaxID=3039116 RepID=UPI00241F8437|nr:WYL domain-containing protein [Anaerocolumna sp. AGMB13025]WFR55579.1 WYL domain-containing protein [Anaerocolumna sp. AGMB13025]
MELFSEIYNCYYSVIAKILETSPLTEKQMQELILNNAFSESAVYLMPKLCKEEGWGLLAKDNANYSSRLKTIPELPVTLLEKRWLKSLLQDSRVRLFLEDTTYKELSDRLSDIKPLYQDKHFNWFDIFADGDDYKSPTYVNNFKLIHKAIPLRNIITIVFKSGKGKFITGDYLPCRLEYSQKNDKFRLYAVKMKGLTIVAFCTINLSRIRHIKNTDLIYPVSIDMEQIFKSNRCKEPVTLEIRTERNGLDRFMMEFAGYEKQTVLDEESGICTASLWYNLKDETELLIRLLGFGPVLKVTGPIRMLEQIKKRVNHQYDLLYPSDQ